MKRKSERIIIAENTPGAFEMNILGAKPGDPRLKLLGIWFLLWTLAGVAIISQFFFDYPRETKLFMVIWLAFWGYFEYRVGQAFFFKKNGKEVIRLAEKKFIYRKETSGRGLDQTFDLEHIKDLKEADSNIKSFANQFNNSYWVLGGEKINMTYFGKEVMFGLQLENEEAADVIQLLRREIAKRK